MFQLPKVDPRIPTRLLPTASRQRGALLARTLLEAGVINDRTLLLEDDHAKNCQTALTNWLNEALGGLECLRPFCRLSVGHLYVEGAAAPLRAEIDWHGSGGTWAIGPALEKLEAFRPKLGMTVLRALEAAAWRTLPIFTPTMVFEGETRLVGEGRKVHRIRRPHHLGRKGRPEHARGR